MGLQIAERGICGGVHRMGKTEAMSQLGGESRANVIVVPGSWLVGCSSSCSTNLTLT